MVVVSVPVVSVPVVSVPVVSVVVLSALVLSALVLSAVVQSAVVLSALVLSVLVLSIAVVSARVVSGVPVVVVSSKAGPAGSSSAQLIAIASVNVIRMTSARLECICSSGNRWLRSAAIAMP